MKETTKAKRQHTKWKEIFVNNTSNKQLVCKIHKANINLSILNTNYPTTDGQKRWMDFVSDKTSRWPPDTRRDTQRHPSSGKCKPQWDVTWQPSEWLKLTTQETTGVGENAKKGEPSCTAGLNAYWYSYFGLIMFGASWTSCRFISLENSGSFSYFFFEYLFNCTLFLPSFRNSNDITVRVIDRW